MTLTQTRMTGKKIADSTLEPFALARVYGLGHGPRGARLHIDKRRKTVARGDHAITFEPHCQPAQNFGGKAGAIAGFFIGRFFP
jgi:hypothetical protein